MGPLVNSAFKDRVASKCITALGTGDFFDGSLVGFGRVMRQRLVFGWHARGVVLSGVRRGGIDRIKFLNLFTLLDGLQRIF